MSTYQIGDVVTARPVTNVRGDRGTWKGIVTHVGDYDGKPTVSGVGLDGHGNLTHLSSYVDEGDVELLHDRTSENGRAILAGLYSREGMSDRTRNRLLELSQIVAFERIAAMFPDGGEKPSHVLDRIYSITHHDSGPASLNLKEVSA